MLAFLLAASTCEGDRGRNREEEFCKSEVARDEFDILTGARRPPMRSLGRDAIRFSSAPSLGGHGIVVEVIDRGSEGANVTAIALYGHNVFGWRIEDRLRIRLSPSRYRRLANRIDITLAGPARDHMRDEDGQEILAACADGPGYLAERIKGDAVVSLTGSCNAEHPNREIARAMFTLLCPRLGIDFPELRHLKALCRPWRHRRG